MTPFMRNALLKVTNDLIFVSRSIFLARRGKRQRARDDESFTLREI